MSGRIPTGEPGNDLASRRRWWNRWFGDRGERLAAQYLRRQGMRILLRGYRTAVGEVDLIARDDATLVFVEVKTRRTGDPVEAVTTEKQRRIVRAARHFAQRHGVNEAGVRCRFDVVAIVWPELGAPQIAHFRAAFDENDVRFHPR